MEYKVVPFTATIRRDKDSVNSVAIQLEQIIDQYTAEGWNYIRVESLSTYIQPDNGCFGFGSKPGYMSSYQMVIFNRGAV